MYKQTILGVQNIAVSGNTFAIFKYAHNDK
jgi:hypothetical protein